ATVKDRNGITRIQVCTGKIYYELLAAREARGATDTAIVRIEQIYPFPEVEFADILKSYRNAHSILCVQEEHRTMAAWILVRSYHHGHPDSKLCTRTGGFRAGRQPGSGSAKAPRSGAG